MSFYKILYINLYRFTLKTPSAEYEPEYTASMVLSLFVATNIASISLILIGLNIDFGNLFFNGYAPMLVTFGGVFILNYLIFIRQKKHEELVKTYEQISTRRKKLNAVLSLSYFVISGLILVVLI